MYALLAAIALGIAVFAASLYFNRGATLRRKMRAIPATSIAAAKEGERVRITGTASGTSLHAPLSGRPCVHYEVLIEEEVIGQKRNYWVKRASETEWIDFSLKDATGEVQVRTVRAKSAALFHSPHSGHFTLDSASVEAFLGRQAAKGIRIPSTPHRNVRMTEAILEIGKPITVVGVIAEGRLQAPPGQELWATDDVEFR